MNESIASPLSWRGVPPAVTLPVGEAHLFAFMLDLPAPGVAALTSLLSPDELQRAGRFHHVRDRDRFVVRRAQLRNILGQYLEQHPRSLEIGLGPHGKPELRGLPHGTGIRFSLSHSQELAVLALQRHHDLGVDVEWIRPLPDALDIAKRFFTAHEYQWLRAVPTAGVDATFFSYWTRREAIVKSIGRGFSLPMDAFEVASDGSAAEAVTITGVGRPVTQWLLPIPSPAPGFVAALATAARPQAIHCWAWADPPGGQ